MKLRNCCFRYFKTSKKQESNEQKQVQAEQSKPSATFSEAENLSFIEDFIPEEAPAESTTSLGHFRSKNALLECYPHLVDLGLI